MQFYRRTNYLSSHLSEIVKWAKVLKVGKNDIMFYKQTNGLASMFSFMMSIENISGVKWCEPLGVDESYDAKFPFNALKNNADEDITIVANTNSLINYLKENEGCTNEFRFYKNAMYDIDVVTMIEGSVSRLELLYRLRNKLYGKLMFEILPLLDQEPIESFDITNDERFCQIMLQKAADGQGMFITPKGFLLTLWPSLVGMNKGDIVEIEIKKDLEYRDCYYCFIKVTKPKKYMKTIAVTRFIQP